MLAFTALAWNRGGRGAGVLTGTLLVTHPVLFELSHYMKEDCSLLDGVALCFLALDLYAERPSLWLAGATGAAAELATSGKLAGSAVALVALAVISATPRNSGRYDWRAALVFFATALLVFCVINADAIRQIGAVQHGLRNEWTRIDELTAERSGKFTIKYVSKFGRVISVPLLLGAGYWIWRRRRGRGAQSLATWALAGFPVLVAMALSVAPATKERYLLPVFAMFCVLGALGIVELAATRPFRHASFAAGALAAFAVAWHLPTRVSYVREFAVDDRRDMAAWIREHLPPEATIAHDRRVRFDYAQKDGLPVDQVPQTTLRPKRYLSELGSPSELRQKGIQFVALCEPDYQALLRPRGKLGETEKSARRFYSQVLEDGRLLWERPGGRLLYLHPGLKLYELP